MVVIGRISTSLNGEDVEVEWQIDGFSFLPEENETSYDSPAFYFASQKWGLEIFPNGWTGRNSCGHIDLSLLKYSLQSSITQQFSLSIKTQKGEKEYEEQCTKVFEGYSCYDFNRFIQRSELLKRHSELMPHDVLTVVCTMKNITSAGSASDVFASESSTSPHEKKLLDDFKELFLKKEDCDIIIKVKGSEIPAHKLILKARSPVFASTFRHNMKESATGIVEIEDCESSSFLDFLRFLYYGDIRMISQENVFSLFTVADKYEVLDLRAKCLEFMKKNMTVDTFCETITLALQHSETELITLATNFFVKNAKEILLTAKWQTFASENATQSNELLIKFVRSVSIQTRETLPVADQSSLY